MIRKTNGLSALAATAALNLAAWSALAQDPTPVNPLPVAQPKGIGERIGEAADRAGKTIRQGVRDTTDSVHAMGVQSRLYSRLHWDKALNDASLDLEVTREGVAILRGAVADARARSRAVELARETVGVGSVVDQLTIRGSTSTTTTTTTTRTPAPRVAP